MEITNINQLDPNQLYSYADYLLWKFKERVELFKGKILKMSPAPAPIHQKISGNIHGEMFQYFKGKSCQLFAAPFDVRFPDEDGNVTSVVQPDLCIICDEAKIDDKGCLGSPDLIIEILSPGNSKKEMKDKFQLYEEAGVLEYWVVHPIEKNILIFILKEGKYHILPPIVEGDVFSSHLFPDLRLNTQDLF